MSVIKGVAVVVGGIVALGVISGGVVRGPDGSVDPGATFKQGAEVGGAQVGDMAGKVADGLGNGAAKGVTSAVGSSDLAKAAAGGAGAYGAWKAWGRWGPGLSVGGPSGDEPPPVTAPPAPVPAPEPEPEPESTPITLPPVASLPRSTGIELGGSGAGQWPGWKPCVTGFGTDVVGTSEC